MKDATPQNFLDQILQKFPYSGRSNQLEILTEFFLLNSGCKPNEVKEQLNIHHNTQRKIRAAWNELSLEEQAYLWNQMSQSINMHLFQNADACDLEKYRAE